MRTVSNGSRTVRTSPKRHSTSTRARSPLRRATSMAAGSESTPAAREAPRRLAAIARTPFPQPRSMTVRPVISPFAVAEYATSAAMPAGVGYCSVGAAENLEELVLLQAQGPPLLQEREDSLPQSAFDGAGLFQPEGPVDDLNREGVERVLDELTRPSRRVDVRRPERFREGPDILLRNGASFCQVPLVHDEKYRHVPHNLECRRNPVVQGVQAVLARQVADAHQGLGTVVVRLSHEVPESPLAHDIKNRHADLDLDVRAVRDGEFDLAHLRADRMQVRVLVLVQDEPSDQRSLPDSALAHECELRLHPADGRHGESRAAPHPESKYKQFRRAKIGASHPPRLAIPIGRSLSRAARRVIPPKN